MRVRKDLTITAGLRWEGQINPQPTTPNPAYPITSSIPNDLKMWQPRLGIAWNVAGKGTTVVRLSAGLFDAHSPGYLMQKVFTDNGLNTLVLDTNVDPTLVNFLTVPKRVDALRRMSRLRWLALFSGSIRTTRIRGPARWPSRSSSSSIRTPK